MRLRVKKEIKSIIRTMLAAHNYLLVLRNNRRMTEIYNLLAQCQDCAIHIGETIEEDEGTDCNAVFLLEEYCEYLYFISKGVKRNRMAELKRQLDIVLYSVEDELDNIFLDTLKIVFMPYKASMWDCMESIWEAAEQDEGCKAYVVPIPYFERNQEGKIEKECYEGNLFPNYVPIISYEEFSLDKEEPDIIYIHNPYDGANYVTCVSPNYYSSNLKKYTDLLVYIPYFICGEGPMPDAHLNLPAYQYVDKIIVQDEMKAKSLEEYVQKDKILAAGSPKVDHLLKLNKEKKDIIKYKIPKEWKKKIEDKKVILFNVSITGILQNSKYAISKIRYVLSMFEKRQDLVLLWRPHPLAEATLKAMRPELYREYIEIKEKFIINEKGIFDETGDAGIAAVIADAYVGESTSSLVNYFGILGKPVLYIDWKMTEDKGKENRNFLYFNTFFKEENSLFFVPVNTGYAHDLYQLDLKNKALSKVMILPGIPDNVDMCYCGIKKMQNKIVLVPHNTKDIYIYDTEKEQAIKVVLPNGLCESSLFSGAVEYKDKLFFIPKCYPAIVSMDIQDLKIHEYARCIEPFRMETPSVWMFGWAYLKKENYLYLASCNDSIILVFNMENGSYEIKKIGDYSKGYVHMIYDGQFFWLASGGENSIIQWEEKTDDTRKYTYPIKEGQLAKGIWSYLIDKGSDIVVCYGFETDIVFINKMTGECIHRKNINNAIDKIKSESIGNINSFSAVGKIDEEKVLVINWENCSANIWNLETDMWQDIKCRISNDEMLKKEKIQIEKYWLSKSVPYNLSEHIISINQFMDYIACGEEANAFKQKYEVYMGKTDKFTVGMAIHNMLKDEKNCCEGGFCGK